MLDRISLILVIIGAINWLLVGLFSFEFGSLSIRRSNSCAQAA